MQDQNENDSAEKIEVVVEEAPETTGSATPDAGGAASADSSDASERSDGAPAKSDDDELEQYSDNVKRRIAKLTGRMRESERREQAAIEYAKALKAENEKYAQNLQQLSQYHLQEYGERLKAQEVLLDQSLKTAIDTGDTAKQIELQKNLADLALEQRRYQSMAAQRQNAAPQPQQPQQQPQQQVVQAQQPDPRAEAWAQRNEWFGKDQAMTLTAFAIHKTLVEEEGFDPTSDTYYREIDTRMRREFPHKFGQRQAQPQTTVAPVVRNGQPAQQKQPTQVRLTPSQVAIAKKLGVSLEQYARQVAKLNTREG